VSFPHAPGVVTTGDTLDDAMHRAAEVLEFAAEDWSELKDTEFPRPRSIDELRSDREFRRQSAVVPFRAKAGSRPARAARGLLRPG
jgi:predicted RNase H-like HicB family nuclease